jgi:outer membrane protein assembly factor BamB
MVTLFAVIVALSALPQGLQISAPILDSSAAKAVQLIFIAILCPLVAGFYGATAWGLWKLKDWSRYTLIAIIVVNFILQLLSRNMSDIFSQSPVLGFFAIVIAFGLRAYIVYWFLDNGQYFNGREDSLQPLEETSKEFPGINTQEKPNNDKMLRILVISSLAGVVTIIVGVVIALVIYVPRQTTSPARYDPPPTRAGSLPVPTKTPQGASARSFASFLLSFDLPPQGNKPNPSGLEHADNIAADGQGNIYLSKSSASIIYEFDKKGAYSDGWSFESDCPNQFLIGDQIFDSNFHFYVMCLRTILEYDLESKSLIARIDGSDLNPQVEFNEMSLYPDGTLLVVARSTSEANHEVLLHIDPKDGTVLKSVDGPVTNIAGKQILPFDLKPAVDSKGNIYILDGDDGTVYKFDAEANYLQQFRNENAATGLTGIKLNYPAYLIAVDQQDRILTIDTSNLVAFDSDGKITGQISMEFAGSVTDMFVSSQNELYIIGLDSANMTANVKIYDLKLYWK